jgi:NAD(P)-dependent dehydrogenase (short-subunit alcohol dehydrogenase family)
MTEIRNRTAVVTGAGSGIGRALAHALAAEGASVVVSDIRRDSAEAVAEEIRRSGGAAVAIACDVSLRESVRELAARAGAAFGPVALLFANAGVSSIERLTELSDADFDWLTQVNFSGVSHCLRAFLPPMVERRAGHVVATASVVGLLPSFLPRHVPYTAAKAGVIAMMLNLREELSELGIGCTVLCPSGVATRIGETPRYRPARFGGPFEPPPRHANAGALPRKLTFRKPEKVARMLLEAVRENRPLVVTDASQRDDFLRGYVDVVLSAFDDCAAFDARG